MLIIPDKARNCFKNFTEWGGLAGVVCYLINGEIVNALIITIIFGVLAICFEKYFNNKFP